MIRLNRKGIVAPKDWHAAVSGSFPDERKYLAAVRRFEKLSLKSKRRRAGFVAYAPSTLATVAGKQDFVALWRTWKKKVLKVKLKAMTEGHCAYCQSPASPAQHAEVEHYQPKSLFPSLAYAWGNYFYSCEICNGSKSNKWPDRGEYVRPDRGDPSQLFLFEADGTIKPAGNRSSAKRMIDDFDLNREDLRKARKDQIKRIVGAVEDLRDKALKKEIPDKLAHELAKRHFARIQDLSPYSVAIKQNLCGVWNAAFPNFAL